MQTAPATPENCMEFPQNTENGITFWPNNSSDMGLISKIYEELLIIKDSTLRKQPTQLKNGKWLEQTVFQGGHTEIPETYEKMLNIASYKRDAN